MATGKSCLVTTTKEFELEAYGKNKRDAIGAIFSKFKKRAYESVDGLIIHMEPDDVILLESGEKTRKEKFLGFFAPKEIQNSYVKVRVIATIKYIEN